MMEAGFLLVFFRDIFSPPSFFFKKSHLISSPAYLPLLSKNETFIAQSFFVFDFPPSWFRYLTFPAFPRAANFFLPLVEPDIARSS